MPLGDTKSPLPSSSVAEIWEFEWGYPWSLSVVSSNLIGRNFGRWRLTALRNETGAKRSASLSAFRGYQKSSSIFFRCGDIEVQVSLLLEVTQADLGSDWLKFSMLTFDSTGPWDRCQMIGLLECLLGIPKVLFYLLPLRRYWGLSRANLESRKTLVSQKWGRKLFSSEEAETGVNRWAFLDALRGYQKFCPIRSHHGDMEA